MVFSVIQIQEVVLILVVMTHILTKEFLQMVDDDGRPRCPCCHERFYQCVAIDYDDPWAGVSLFTMSSEESVAFRRDYLSGGCIPSLGKTPLEKLEDAARTRDQ